MFRAISGYPELSMLFLEPEIFLKYPMRVVHSNLTFDQEL